VYSGSATIPEASIRYRFCHEVGIKCLGVVTARAGYTTGGSPKPRGWCNSLTVSQDGLGKSRAKQYKYLGTKISKEVSNEVCNP
jgi:hypothetical protein